MEQLCDGSSDTCNSGEDDKEEKDLDSNMTGEVLFNQQQLGSKTTKLIHRCITGQGSCIFHDEQYENSSGPASVFCEQCKFYYCKQCSFSAAAKRWCRQAVSLLFLLYQLHLVNAPHSTPLSKERSR